MREILFKAKRIDNGEWVEGYLINEDCGCFIMPEDYISERQLKNNHYGYELILIKAYEVDFETICQYTGLTDKNGNKIWENDIVTHTYTTYKDDENSYPPFRSEKKQKNYVIKFDSTASFLGYRYHNSRNIFPFKKGTVINGDDVVVGNIFDNPELLGV